MKEQKDKEVYAVTQLNQLSYSRLISRTTYYRDKALELDKQLAFTEEKMNELNEKLALAQKEKEEIIAQREKTVKQYGKTIEELKEENKRLIERIEMLQTSQASKSQGVEQMEKKIEGYEKLLTDIQEEINKKEKEVDYYKSRMKSLEKRASYLSVPQIQLNRRNATVEETEDQDDQKLASVISYFDYLLLWQSEQKFIIRGDFHIKNIGKQWLKNPALCFRFSHPELSTMKGKIISIDQASIDQRTSQAPTTQWMFLESEWTKEARNRGEIWIVPTGEMVIPPGGTVVLHEFQIPVQKPLNDTFVIEGFVYFHDHSVKEKAINHIMVSA